MKNICIYFQFIFFIISDGKFPNYQSKNPQLSITNPNPNFFPAQIFHNNITSSTQYQIPNPIYMNSDLRLIYQLLSINKKLFYSKKDIFALKAYIIYFVQQFFYSMKRNIGRYFPFVLVLLISHVACYQQYSYSFYYNQSLVNPTSNPKYLPSYSLGVLSVGYSLRITFSIPKTGSLSGSQLDIALSSIPQRMELYYLSPSTGLPVLAQTSSGSFGFPKVSGNQGTYQTNYEVYFTDSTMLSAQFKLVINGNLALASNKLTYFSINVNSQKIKSVSFGESPSTILKVTEVFRDKIIKFFHVGPSSNPTTMFTAYPITSDGINIINPFKFQVSRLSSSVNPLIQGNRWQMDQVSILGQTMEEETNPESPVFMNQVGHYEISLPKGFYVLIITIDPSVLNHFSARITFESDAYICPYLPDFTDYYQNFQGCNIQPSRDSGLPCLSFNNILGKCTVCMDGYYLQDGSCLANTNCPDRQYYSFGQCLDVDPLCELYDKFTGLCLSCKDTLNYLFDNGRCIYQEVYCGSRQYKIDRQCFNVSTTCANFDSTNGKCIDCINNMYQLTSDGACTAITVKCPPNTFLYQLKCYPIPPECADFDETRGLCNKCIRGYQTTTGFCKKIECPKGQVPSQYDEACRDVSPQCKEYDEITGDCLSCKNSEYSVRNGKCSKVFSTLAGCMERQKLGYGECVGAEYFCKIFDLVSLNCNQCYDGYYLDYTGKCSKQPECGPGKWAVNGQCLSYPHNCIKVDKIGLCIQSENQNYRLQLGQCVYFKKCQDRQYLTPQGQCKSVSPFCATWHPSNGLCITCQIQDTKPNQGVCCPKGKIFRGTSCMVPEAPYPFDSSQKCFIRHPSLQFCLRCAEGYEPDYGIPYACREK